jgi:hypothetical protein
MKSLSDWDQTMKGNAYQHAAPEGEITLPAPILLVSSLNLNIVVSLF